MFRVKPAKSCTLGDSLPAAGLDDLLPDAAPLVVEQAAVAGFRHGGNVMGQVFPLAAGFEHVQDAIENFPLVGPRPSGPRAFRQQGAQIVPVDIRPIGAVRLPGDRKDMR